MKVKEVMVTEPIVVKAPCTRKTALKQMVLHEISGVPVLDKKTDMLIGIVTRKDIFRNSEETQLPLIMTTEPVTVDVDDDIKKAAKLMYEGNINRLPVLDGNRVVGIVTPTDLMGVVEKKGTGSVDDYVRGACVPVYEETPLAVVISIIRTTQVYSLPILDGSGNLAGIITDTDLFHESHIDEDVVISDLGIGSDEDKWTWEGLRSIMKLYYVVEKVELPDLRAKDIMIKDVRTVFGGTPVGEAARTMKRFNFGQIPVLDHEDRLKGIVYDLDLLRTLI